MFYQTHNKSNPLVQKLQQLQLHQATDATKLDIGTSDIDSVNQ